jgi:hypothetical protein
MSSDYASMLGRVRQLVATGVKEGWATPAAAAALEQAEQATPADLFAEQQQRPLVVAFFGGTGVGKSSLLNRLAGQPVARVGVERPTSREITLFVHRDVQLADFPQSLPLDSVKVQRHGESRQRDIVWVDMPDVDSTEAANRACALAWLPHIDLLIYVVSPERYRDDAGWRVLLERGRRHGWLFVMNHWDEGDTAQRDDFVRMLRTAGFDEPVVLTTSCLSNAAPATPDQFGLIQKTIGALLANHGLRELERLGHRARLEGLRTIVADLATQLGDAAAWSRIRGAAERHTARLAEVLREGLTWPIQSLAERFAARSQSAQPSLRERIAARSGLPTIPKDAPPPRPTADDAAALVATLWDDWARRKLALRLDAIDTDAQSAGVHVPRLRRRLGELGESGGPLVLAQIEDSLRRELASPGTAWQRRGRMATGFLMAVLPGIALVWVAWTLVQQYARAATGAAPYPGVDFAVGSLLLIGVAWALPFWLDRLLTPSLQRAVERALASGLGLGLADFNAQTLNAIDSISAEIAHRRQELDTLQKQIAGMLVRPIRSDRPEVGRLIAVPEAAESIRA